MQNFQEKYNEYLFAQKAFHVNLEELFELGGGMKIPTYCNNRKPLGLPESRSFIASSFATIIRYELRTPAVIVGVATAGITSASILAHTMNLEFSYGRTEPKDYGLYKQIECMEDVRDKNVLVVEDTIFEGKAILAVIDAIEKDGGNVIGVLSQFDYGLTTTQEALQKLHIASYSLSNFVGLCHQAVKTGYITEAVCNELMLWHKDPVNWKPTLVTA